VPIVWWGVREAGLTGAAVGTLVAGLLYLLIVAVGPGGFVWLLRETRLRAIRASSGAAPLEVRVD
jgi:hypothetical protein